MFLRLRRHLNYANVVATFALVFAMSGGALAATHYLITTTKQIKPSVLASLKGKTGANGAQGAAGAQGAQGPAGSAGAKGDNGAAGANGTDGEPGKEGAPGTNGKNGTSIASTEFSGEKGTCKEGGSELKSSLGVSSYACNGKPWTDGGTLPEGKTETGVWSVVNNGGSELKAWVPISFTIPLKAGLGGTQVHFFNIEETGPAGSGCAGGTAENPTAEPGNLCVYSTHLEDNEGAGFRGIASADNSNFGESGAGPTGAFLRFSEIIGGFGTWAVTESEK